MGALLRAGQPDNDYAQPGPSRRLLLGSRDSSGTFSAIRASRRILLLTGMDHVQVLEVPPTSSDGHDQAKLGHTAQQLLQVWGAAQGQVAGQLRGIRHLISTMGEDDVIVGMPTRSFQTGGPAGRSLLQSSNSTTSGSAYGDECSFTPDNDPTQRIVWQPAQPQVAPASCAPTFLLGALASGVVLSASPLIGATCESKPITMDSVLTAVVTSMLGDLASSVQRVGALGSQMAAVAGASGARFDDYDARVQQEVSEHNVQQLLHCITTACITTASKPRSL